MHTPTGSELVWVRYNPRTAMLLLMGLSPEAELAHRRLSDYIWSGAPWPAPDFSIAGQLACVPADRWESVLQELARLGWRTRKGHLFNATVEAIRKEALDALAARKAKSRAANTARWSRRRTPPRTPPGIPQGDPTRTPEYGTVQNRTVQDIAVNPAERLTCSGLPREQAADGEADFLKDLREALGRFSAKKATAELENWGGWWRNRYRENPAKAQRVLAELQGPVLK